MSRLIAELPSPRLSSRWWLLCCSRAADQPHGAYMPRTAPENDVMSQVFMTLSLLEY